jgi:P-type Ca2+ transporter type 2C
MVLTDDNFATIVHAIEEGRTIYGNLQRVVFFLLATNLGEILTLVTALLLGLDLPLTAVMVLWINLVTDGACTIPLGIEPRHRDVLKHPPIEPGASILSRSILFRMFLLTPLMMIGTLGLFVWCHNSGMSLAYSRSVAFTTLAAFQWFQAFNARSRQSSVFSIGLLSNRWLLLGVGSAVVLQVMAIQTPLGKSLFGTTPLSLSTWLLVIGVAGSIWVADEILKALGVYRVVK